MILDLLFEQPMVFVAWLIAIVFSISIHEFAHAYAANSQGDPTAKLLGRLTLNPLSHIDPMGFFALLLVGFGWGKPVPVNPINFRNKKWGDVIVSFAGPLSNFVMILTFGIILKLTYLYTNLGQDNLMIQFLFFIVMINIVLGIFNLIPIPPLDGSHILFSILPSNFNEFKYQLAKNGPMLLLVLILADNFLNIGIFSSLFNYIFNLVGRLIF
ncbi:MAG: site-2 protease family protein [Patescibacteria group bacterium]|nr:site-2 protease family protein [Patescibacteria group bacterium]MDD4695525.1 site-2 protease family protein [Patescibacteria group bacterium]